MADIFDSIDNKQDVFDQISNAPGGVTGSWEQQPDQPVATQNPGSHPTFGPPQYNFNPLSAFAKGAYQGAQGIDDTEKKLALKFLGANPDAMKKTLDFVNGQMAGAPLNQMMQKIPEAMPGTGASIAQNVGQTAVGSLPAVGAGAVMGGPLGFGAANAVGAFANNQNPVMPFVKGAVMGKGLELAGGVGSTFMNSFDRFGQRIGQDFANRAGSALGGGIAGATVSNGDPSAVIQGAGLGATFPQQSFGAPKQMTQDEYNALIEKHGNTYRDILNPTKGTIQKVEVKSGKNLDDAMQLAAQSGLVINKDVENKLDTLDAVKQLQLKINDLHQQLNTALQSDPNKQFDLEDLRDSAKTGLSQSIKNAEDLAKAHAQVDNAIDAEVARNNNSPFVNGSKLNDIKQGLWSKSYNPLEPNSNVVSRKIGNVAKDMIEQGYHGDDVKGLNQQMGKYLDLQKILEVSHGNVVQKGKIGRYAAQGIGALTGFASHIPGGEIAGALLGGKVSDIMNDPARITQGIANEINNINITNPNVPFSRRPGVVNPQVMGPGQQFAPMAQGMPSPQSPVGSLPAPLPAYLQARQAMPSMGANQPSGSPISSNPIQMRGYVPPGLPAPIPKYLQDRQNIPPMNIPTGSAESSNVIPMGGASQKATTNQTNPNVFNPLANAVKPQGLPNGVKALGLAGAIGLGSMFNPLNSQAAVKEPERLNLPANEYTKKEEGFQAYPYVDTKGNKTIGYGFKMDAVGKYLPELVQQGKRPLTKPEADQIFTKLYANARNQAQGFAGDAWHNLNGQQQKSLSDLAYNMGGKLNGFKNLRKAITNGDYQGAAREIMDSQYAKEAKNRVSRNASLMTM